MPVAQSHYIQALTCLPSEKALKGIPSYHILFTAS